MWETLIINSTPEKPVISIDGSTDLCQGEVLTASVNFDNVVWTDNITYSTRNIDIPGNYSVRVVEGSCLGPYSDTLIVSLITSPPKAKIFSETSLQICLNDSCLLSSAYGYDTYIWKQYVNGIEISSNKTMNNQFYASSSGEYKVIYDKNGCKGELSDKIDVLAYNCDLKMTDHELKINNGYKQTDYQIISFPMRFNEPTVRNIVSNHFGPFNEHSWRLFHYSQGQNTKYPDDFLIFEQGKAYWIISKDSSSISISEGTYINYDDIPVDPKPYILTLDRGWNQIGNPFIYDVSWQDVLETNDNNSAKYYNSMNMR